MERRVFGRDQWIVWLQEYGESGLSIKKFCQRIGVSENRFYHWRKKLINESRAESAKIAGGEAFVPVSVISPQQTSASMDWSIDLPGGAILRIPGDEPSLRLVLKCLMEVKALS